MEASPSRLKMRQRGEQRFVISSRASDTFTRTPRRCSSGLIATTPITGPASSSTRGVSRTDSWMLPSTESRPIMAAAVPEVPNLSYLRMGLGTEVVFYSDTPDPGARGVYSHEQFSEGTLRLLGMLFDLAMLPLTTSIVLIEEPETFLQASVVRSMSSFLAEVAMNHDVQMVISTHSPELIDSELVLPVRSWCCTQKMRDDRRAALAVK